MRVGILGSGLMGGKLGTIFARAAYAALAVCWFTARSYTREALFGVGGAALLLLFIGIHNAWDNVAYHVLVNLAGAKTERQRDESKSQSK